MRPLAATPILLVLLAATAQAQEDPPAKITAEDFESSLNYARGRIELPGGVATLELSPDFKYLGPDDTERVIEQAWGNPEGSGTLGMLFPEQYTTTEKASWGVIITYEEDGHVSDADADGIDYDELLEQMRAGEKEDNEEREKQGYEPVTLVGWGEPPHYDKAAHKLHWAKRLRFGQAEQDTLNYNIRILGREGVLVLNAVAGMNQLADIKPHLGEVVAFTDFTPGNRYQDFDESTDKTAAYGLAALIAGGVAAKTGLIAKLVALLVAFKKVAILAVAGLAALVGRWFKGRKASPRGPE